MDLLKIFKSKKKSISENSAVNSLQQVQPREAFIDHLLNRGFFDLAYYQMLDYYNSCGPLADAIDRRANEVKTIQPVVFNTKTEEIITDHPVLELLAAPNPVDTFQSLITRLSTFYDATGNVFLLSTGSTKKPPLEIFAVSPATISMFEELDGFVSEYTGTAQGNFETYKRNTVQGKFRYYSDAMTAPTNKELRHMKDFGTTGTLTSNRGISPVQSIYFDIQQYINAGLHNLSTLKRGARPSGILTLKDEESYVLSDDQRAKLKEELKNYYSGAENAGRVGFLDVPLDWHEMSQTNKDMDFLELKRDTESMIYTRYNIPAPFVTEETMAMANRTSARLDFYQDAILPLLNTIYQELTLLLMYRYPDSENLIITYDISKIPALEPRKLDQIAKLNDLGAFSKNEIRAKLGENPASGGDSILVPTNLVPLEQVTISDTLSEEDKGRLEFIEKKE
jgi:HK97 family phage portal protein